MAERGIENAAASLAMLPHDRMIRAHSKIAAAHTVGRICAFIQCCEHAKAWFACGFGERIPFIRTRPLLGQMARCGLCAVFYAYGRLLKLQRADRMADESRAQ